MVKSKDFRITFKIYFGRPRASRAVMAGRLWMSLQQAVYSNNSFTIITFLTFLQ